MSRIRTIKPEFFLHEGLAELSPVHRLLFVGLWTLCDREGRLEDRPKRIKAMLFPWDDLEVDALLADLDASGFVQRYEAGESQYLAIPAFLKHQRPHPKEAPSTIPAPPSREKKRQAVKRNAPAAKGLPRGEGLPVDLGMDNGNGSGKDHLAGADAPRPVLLKLEPVDVNVPKPRARSEAQQFFDDCMVLRADAGLPDDAEPKTAKLNSWFRTACEEVKDDARPRMLAAYERFLSDQKFAVEAGKPFALFMTDSVWKPRLPALDRLRSQAASPDAPDAAKAINSKTVSEMDVSDLNPENEQQRGLLESWAKFGNASAKAELAEWREHI
jgi:hypothetical protein